MDHNAATSNYEKDSYLLNSLGRKKPGDVLPVKYQKYIIFLYSLGTKLQYNRITV